MTASVMVASFLLAGSHVIMLDSEIPDLDHFKDPETDILFPSKIKVASKTNIPALTLLGAGVRRVSILQVKVYSVGIYADLSNPNLRITPDMSAEEKLAHVVKNCACVIRIVPTRTTSYSHLRDAFTRNLQQRLIQAKKKGLLAPEDEQEVQSPLRKLKSLFPTTSIEKHQPFDIFLPEPMPGKPRSLVFRDLGAVENNWVATEFIMSYVEGLSPALKKELLARSVSL
jgi:hypothetical protein